MLLLALILLLGFPVCLVLWMRERKRVNMLIFTHQRRIAELEGELARARENCGCRKNDA